MRATYQEETADRKGLYENIVKFLIFKGSSKRMNVSSKVKALISYVVNDALQVARDNHCTLNVGCKEDILTTKKGSPSS